MSTVSSNANKLFEDLQAVVRDTEALLKATAHLTGEKIESVRADATSNLARAKARLGEVQDQVLAAAGHTVKATDDYVKTNPWTSVGIAAGVGLMAGLLLNHRR